MSEPKRAEFVDGTGELTFWARIASAEKQRDALYEALKAVGVENHLLHNKFVDTSDALNFVDCDFPTCVKANAALGMVEES